MNIYIATGLDNAHRAQIVRDAFALAGHRVTYDWTKHGAIGHQGVNALVQAAYCEVEGVTSADLVVVLLPGARGTHAELGMALALGKPVIIWDETGEAFPVNNSTCAFYWHPLVKKRRMGYLCPERAREIVATAEMIMVDVDKARGYVQTVFIGMDRAQGPDRNGITGGQAHA